MGWVINRHVRPLMDCYTTPLPHPPWLAWIKPLQPWASFPFSIFPFPFHKNKFK
ncbi:hypothetical protein HanIR_Chr11g0534511 [Helianthus annuus]|nr:hypothetical protein HanIR_Chr11g0534511 [Helianthus annuus]